MNAYIKTMAKQIIASVLLAAFALSSHAATRDVTTGEVRGTDFVSRSLSISDSVVEKSYRVALSATVILLDGGKGVLEEVNLGDIIVLELDRETGDIQKLSVVAQN